MPTKPIARRRVTIFASVAFTARTVTRAAGAAHVEDRAVRHLLDPHRRAHRDVVHIDQVLPQRLEVDLRPVGARVGVEDPHDLGDGREGFLAGARRLGTLRGGGRVVRHAGCVHVRLRLRASTERHEQQHG